MGRILSFIAAYMGFLWKDARFRITNSEVATSQGGDAFLLVESRVLRMRFVCDRGQLLLDFQPAGAGSRAAWHSVDLIRRMVLGRREESGLLDEGYADFIREHLDDIEELFRDVNWPATEAQLRGLKAKRSKELFG